MEGASEAPANQMNSNMEVAEMCMYLSYVMETDEHDAVLGHERSSRNQCHRGAPKPEKTFQHDPLATSEAWQFAKHLDAGAGI